MWNLRVWMPEWKQLMTPTKIIFLRTFTFREVSKSSVSKKFIGLKKKARIWSNSPKWLISKAQQRLSMKFQLRRMQTIHQVVLQKTSIKWQTKLQRSRNARREFLKWRKKKKRNGSGKWRKRIGRNAKQKRQNTLRREQKTETASDHCSDLSLSLINMFLLSKSG